MADPPLASFSLTHVHYNPRDPLSHACAWLALLPQGLCIAYSILLFSTREIEIALAFSGQLACEALNWGLKRLIKEQRPEKVRVLGKGYGMPSSHAQFVGFWSVYVSLWLWVRFRPRRKVDGAMRDPMRSFVDSMKERDMGGDGEGAGGEKKEKDKEREKRREERHKRRKSEGDAKVSSTTTPVKAEKESLSINTMDGTSSPVSTDESSTVASPVSPAFALQLHHPHLTKAFLSAGLLTIGFLVCISRIYLSYHTTRQVYIGYLVGAAFATIFFLATEIARRWGYIDLLLEYPLLRLYRIRDLCCEEDLIELGWGVWEEKRRRQRKLRRKSVRFAGLPKEEEDGKGEKVKKIREEKKSKKKS